jgi:hypothetical protein
MIRTLMIAATLFVAAPALAANKLMPPGAAVAVAKSALTVTPDREWNKLSARPGKLSESWTIDGDVLNRLSFYGGVLPGTTLFREVDKKNRPLPKVRADMLPTDIPALFEQSYRIAENSGLFTIDAVEPATLGGAAGVRFTFSFSTEGEDVARKGEAIAAMVGGKLWLISFEAPALHYHDAGIAAARAVMQSARLPGR